MKFKHIKSKTFMFVSEWKTVKFWANWLFETSDKKIIESLKKSFDYQNWLIEEFKEISNKAGKKEEVKVDEEIKETETKLEVKVDEEIKWENFDILDK